MLLVGQMEITFLIGFCQSGNLVALLQDESKLPPLIRPYAQQLRAIFDPRPSVPRKNTSIDSHILDKDVITQLVDHLNGNDSNNTWLASDAWSFLSAEEKEHHSPVTSHATLHKSFEHCGVTFSTFEQEPKNSVVHVVEGSTKAVSFGKIVSIFTHKRISTSSIGALSDTWFCVEPFAQVPRNKPDPFLKLGEPDIQAHLRLARTSKAQVRNLDEIKAHCAWIEYAPHEIADQLNMKTVALISLER